MAHESRTILFMPESAYGPTNNCIGIGDILRRRGHRVVFAAERSWAGNLEALGFAEDLVDLAPPPENAGGDPGRDRLADLSADVRARDGVTRAADAIAGVAAGAGTASRR